MCRSRSSPLTWYAAYARRACSAMVSTCGGNSPWRPKRFRSSSVNAVPLFRRGDCSSRTLRVLVERELGTTAPLPLTDGSCRFSAVTNFLQGLPHSTARESEAFTSANRTEFGLPHGIVSARGAAGWPHYLGELPGYTQLAKQPSCRIRCV